ncbi:signal peptidase I [Brachybacterium massiliense]|uniref:signal peptidase I n=1 Tax=Brachybacterium massiliense TaxID=1755098 RepID=UPI000B3BB8A4|nr:signal peptidase I [Brachybacterium massiliense]
MNTAAGSSSTESPRVARPSRGLLGHLLNGILNLAAVGGALCVVLVILAVVFDISLILFRTGSMTPTIPQGSLAVVQEIPAAEVEVGDVVTVDREDALPITHRVTSVTELPDGQRQITMKGDANDAADTAPYTVAEVRQVLFSIPGLAKPVAALNSPYLLGGVTLAVSALVVWALWPRGRPGTEQHDADADADADTDTDTGDAEAER